jgi:hypothetical protein
MVSRVKPFVEAASFALALALGGAGAALAWAASVPAPFILGPAVAVTIAGIAGLRTDVPLPFRNIAFVVIGAIMGSGVTPQVLETARQWPLSFVALGVTITVIMAITTALLQKLWRYDRITAVLSSAPGHMSFVMSLGAETGGNLAAISIVQSIRLLCLTLIVPVIVAFGGFELPETTPHSAGAMPLLQLTAMLPVCLAAGYALHRLRLPAGYLIGAMLVSTAAHLSGLADGAVPAWLAVPCLVAMGTMIGTRFSGVTIRQLGKFAGAGLLSTLIAFAVAAAGALAAARLTGLAPGPMLVAFAPGGVETMAAIALQVNADPAFVAAHHVMRLFMLTALIPLFLGGTPRT